MKRLATQLKELDCECHSSGQPELRPWLTEEDAQLVPSQGSEHQHRVQELGLLLGGGRGSDAWGLGWKGRGLRM